MGAFVDRGDAKILSRSRNDPKSGFGRHAREADHATALAGLVSQLRTSAGRQAKRLSAGARPATRADPLRRRSVRVRVDDGLQVRPAERLAYLRARRTQRRI